jgi:hypothetical protein
MSSFRVSNAIIEEFNLHTTILELDIINKILYDSFLTAHDTLMAALGKSKNPKKLSQVESKAKAEKSYHIHISWLHSALDNNDPKCGAVLPSFF